MLTATVFLLVALEPTFRLTHRRPISFIGDGFFFLSCRLLRNGWITLCIVYTPMKNLILSAFIAFTICLGGAYAQTATISPAPLKPKWTLRLPSQITLSDGTQVSGVAGQGTPALVDSSGNAAYFAVNFNQSIVLWISSSGKLLAAIPGAQALSVSGTAIWIIDEPGGVAKYTLVKGRLIKTMTPVGYYGDLLLVSGDPQRGFVGITETDGSGNLISLSGFLY